MILPNDIPQQPQTLPQEHWDSLPELPLLSGPTIPTFGRRFFKHSPATILKFPSAGGEGTMTALAYSILGSCVPRVISIVTIPIKSADVTVPNRTKPGLIITHQPGTPLVILWPSLTSPQREAIKSELCHLLVLMRSHKFSYYGRPTKQPYVFFSELGTDIYTSCSSRLEWDDSRVHALQKYALDAQRLVDLERVQRDTTGGGAGDWDRPVLTHWDLSDRNILVDPDTLIITGFIDWEMANIMPAYFEYAAARLSGGHQPEWRKELLDVLRSVLRYEEECDSDTRNQEFQGAAEGYTKTLAAWDAIVDVERFAQGYDDDCYWTFEP